MTEMKTLTIGTQTYELVDGKAIHFNAPQDLSPEEKAQALDNIGAASGASATQLRGYLDKSTDFNTVKTPGYYWISTWAGSGGANYPINQDSGFLHVYTTGGRHGGEYIQQEYFSANLNIKAQRFLNLTDGYCTEWEWVNPPMALGPEYCTTEKWQNKPVYTKLIDFGYLPDAGSEKRVSVEIPEWPDISIVDVNGVIYNPNENAYFSLNAPQNITAYIYDGKIIMECETSRTHQTAKIIVKYIKN